MIKLSTYLKQYKYVFFLAGFLVVVQLRFKWLTRHQGRRHR